MFAIIKNKHAEPVKETALNHYLYGIFEFLARFEFDNIEFATIPEPASGE